MALLLCFSALRADFAARGLGVRALFLITVCEIKGRRRPTILTAHAWGGWWRKGALTPVISYFSETLTVGLRSACTAVPASLLAPGLRGAPIAHRSAGRSTA
jgi:hypothetical protein